MKSEDVAAWYFRLNGFFTIINFVLHPSRRGGQRTDADIVGVRFPYRAEFPDGPGGDDPEFGRVCDKPYFVIAESTTGPCKLNGPWTKREKKNIHAVLSDLGVFKRDLIPCVAENLYEQGVYNGNGCFCSLFCLGESRSAEIGTCYPRVPQRVWDEVLGFIYDRFQMYHSRKADHDHWDDNGKQLWQQWKSNRNSADHFKACVRRLSGLSSNPS